MCDKQLKQHMHHCCPGTTLLGSHEHRASYVVLFIPPQAETVLSQHSSSHSTFYSQCMYVDHSQYVLCILYAFLQPLLHYIYVSSH